METLLTPNPAASHRSPSHKDKRTIFTPSPEFRQIVYGYGDIISFPPPNVHADATDPPPSPIFSSYCAQGGNRGRGEKSIWMLSFTRIKTGDKRKCNSRIPPPHAPFSWFVGQNKLPISQQTNCAYTSLHSKSLRFLLFLFFLPHL